MAVLRYFSVYSEGGVGLYSSSGSLLFSVTPTSYPVEVALSGPNLVVFEEGPKLALYGARSGLLRKTFTLHGMELVAGG